MSKLKNIFKNKIFLTIFLSGIVFGIVFLLPGFFKILDKKITYYFLYDENKKISNDIIMVNLDDSTIQNKKVFPFSRSVYSEIINKLKSASVVAFDIILSDNNPDILGDNVLSKTLSGSNVVLGSQIVDSGYKFIIPPLDKFTNPGKSNKIPFGYFTPKVDNITGEVYSFLPRQKLYIKELPIKGHNNKGEPSYYCLGSNNEVTNNSINEKICNNKKSFNHFTIEIVKKYNHQKNNTLYKNSLGISINDLKLIPYSGYGKKEILINYIPRYNIKNKQKNFTELSMLDILNETNVYKKINFKDKIVIIGATAKGLKDVFQTPYGEEFGVYIHGNIVNTLLGNEKPLIYFNIKLELLLIYLFVISIITLNFSKNNKYLLFGNLLFIFGFYLLNIIFINKGLVLNHPSYLVLAFILSITFSNIAKYLIENKDKKKMLKALGEYISKDIANKILRNEGGIRLEGEKKKISIFFSDIAGFTTISEKMDATELVEFLREYLGDMSNIIMDERGFINKYEGDAIMALFGVFGYEKTSNYDNCKSALLQQEALKRLNAGWKEKYGETLSVRMGLHLGEAIIGNIGSIGRKMEFTALGDSVNLASRLEGVNKFYSTDICVSENVYQDQKENFEFRKLDKIRVKGKNKPIIIYELLNFKNKLSKLQEGLRIGFEKALELYFNGDFKEASKIFKKLGELGDKPSLVFSRRCLKFEITPPKDNWTGIWDMDEK